jgi:mannitol 2-dehydrogenase
MSLYYIIKPMKTICLKWENLSQIAKPVTVPAYNRKSLLPSITHIGLGNFHRSHQACYLDELLNRNLANTGIVEINLIPDSFPLGKILAEQDYLYTLVTKGADGQEETKVIGSILDYVNAPENKQKALDRIAAEETKLVTLTVTENGYYYDKTSGGPDLKEEVVRHDLEHPDDPSGAAGFLAAGLAGRYRANRKPLTIMSCDNIPANGKLLKKLVLYFCREAHPEILSWVEDNVSFPCSMVDRITPVTTPLLVRELEERRGIHDNWPVCAEDFRQWVLEDDFKTPVPDYGAVGVQLVKDAEPYELMKMRLLNGSHSALAYPGYLLGYRKVDDAMKDPLLRDFIRRRYMEEVTPTLRPVPGIDLDLYKDTLVSRFSNSNISDTVERLASQGSGKIPNFILNPLADTIRAGGRYDAIAFALASWARFLSGFDEEGRSIVLEDARAKELSEAAKNALRQPGAFLKTAGLQNTDGGALEALGRKFAASLERINAGGTKRALEEFLKAGV